jgi:hypothetical protein
MLLPCLASNAAIVPRSRTTSARASSAVRQMWVPVSTTDWMSSGLTCSISTRRPSSRICDTYEPSSPVVGSMIWNSSSTPIVNGKSALPGS